jgi:hypothetical protein
MPASKEFTKLCNNINKMFEGLVHREDEDNNKKGIRSSYAIFLPEHVGAAIQGDWRKPDPLFPTANYKYGLARLEFTEQDVERTSFTEEFVQAFQDKLTQAYAELPKKMTGNIHNEKGRYGSILKKLEKVGTRASDGLRNFVKIKTDQMQTSFNAAPDQKSKNVVIREMVDFYDKTRDEAKILDFMLAQIERNLEGNNDKIEELSNKVKAVGGILDGLRAPIERHLEGNNNTLDALSNKLKAFDERCFGKEIFRKSLGPVAMVKNFSLFQDAIKKGNKDEIDEFLEHYDAEKYEKVFETDVKEYVNALPEQDKAEGRKYMEELSILFKAENQDFSEQLEKIRQQEPVAAASKESSNPFGEDPFAQVVKEEEDLLIFDEIVNEEENLLIENITAVMESVKDKKIDAISNNNGLSVEEKKEKTQKLTKNMNAYKENISQEIKNRVDMGSKKAIAAVIRESANPTPENKAEATKVITEANTTRKEIEQIVLSAAKKATGEMPNKSVAIKATQEIKAGVQKIKGNEQPKPTGDEPTPESFTPKH